MPMNSAQLAALVDRARQKPPPVVSPLAPAPQRKLSDNPPKAPKQAPAEPPTQPTPATPQPHWRSEAAQHSTTTSSDDFPTGWKLTKESWYFHRRFYRVFRRPMAHGEYSHLLWQVRRAKAEHLWEDCWRVTLPDGKRTLAVRATRWQLLTILPMDWQPPVPAE
jgi:hypothetical protein